MAKKRKAAAKKVSKKTQIKKNPKKPMPKPNRGSAHGLMWFIIGVIVIVNHWVGIAWPVLIGALISLMGLHKYIHGR